MSFGRWLLTHSLSLFLVVMLLAAWFWRDELELERAWAQLRQVGSHMEQAGTQPEQKAPVASSAAEQDRLADGEADRRNQKSPESDRQPAAAVDNANAPNTAGQAAPRESAADVKPSSARELLQAARKAFWSRDFQRSIEIYQGLIDAEPDNPDYRGELGNVYYNLNRFDRAAEQFHRAGLLLVEQGDSARARQLLPALMSLDRSLGQDLQQALERSGRQAVDRQS